MSAYRPSLRGVATFLVLVAFVAYFLVNKEDLTPIMSINPVYLVFISSIFLVTLVSNGMFTKFIMASFERPIDTQESVYVSLIASVGNFFAPAGSGFGLRAVYLKKKHRLPYSDYAAMLSGNYILVFLVVSVLGVGSLLFLDTPWSITSTMLLIVFSGLFVFSSLLLGLKKIVPQKWLELRHTRVQGRVASIMLNISSGWSKIVTDRRLLFRLLGLVLVNTAMGIAAMYLITRSLGLSINIAGLGLFTALNSLAMFISITPGNLGVKEAVYIFSAASLGLTTEQILLIALVDRAVQFFVLSSLWVFYVKKRSSTMESDLQTNPKIENI